MKPKSKKKKNKLVPLLAAVLTLAVLGGVYALVLADNARKAAEAAAEEAAKNAKIMLAEYKNTDVRFVEYSYEGEVIRLENKNDFWYNADDNTFPLSQTQPASMASALATIAADRLVEESASDFATYGLDEPYAYIYVKYSDNTGMKMVFGDLNSFTGSRYMNIDGTGKVYLVQTGLLDYFKYTHNDLMTHDTVPPIEFTALKEIIVTNLSEDGKTSVLRYYKETPAAADTEESPAETTADEVWILESDSGEPAEIDKDTVRELLESVTGLSLVNCAAYNVRDDETLRKYGLGSAAAKTVTVKYTEKVDVTGETTPISSTAARTVDKEFSVAFSAPDENGESYVNIVGSRLIYFSES
jgi:hypothetical protein